MTEADWLTCPDPLPMLQFLRGKTSARKLRLFAVACSRRIWPWIDEAGRAAVEVAECYADGLASDDALRAARLACRFAGSQAAWYAAATHPDRAAGNAARSAQTAATALSAERAAQAALLRDIAGNPFRPIPPSLRQMPSVLALAIYEERDFARISELADVLERVGADEELLRHLRADGPHVRGCWVVDGILSRE
jgi:hypothetical protein